MLKTINSIIGAVNVSTAVPRGEREPQIVSLGLRRRATERLQSETAQEYLLQAREACDICELSETHLARLILDFEYDIYIRTGKVFIEDHLARASFGSAIWYEIQCVQAAICAVDLSSPALPWLNMVKTWKGRQS